MTSGHMIEERRTRDFYARLRIRLNSWFGTPTGHAYRFAEHLLVLPDLAHLMVRLALDRRVPGDLRAQTAAVLAYVMSPFDLVPEAVVGPLGFGDDVLLVALMVRRLLTAVPSEIVLEHWAGPRELMVTIRRILDVAEEMAGSRVWRRLQRMIGGGEI